MKEATLRAQKLGHAVQLTFLLAESVFKTH